MITPEEIQKVWYGCGVDAPPSVRAETVAKHVNKIIEEEKEKAVKEIVDKHKKWIEDKSTYYF